MKRYNNVRTGNGQYIKILLIVLAVFLVLLGILYGIRQEQIKVNDKKIAVAVSELSYTEERADKEMAELEAIAKEKPISVNAASELYTAMSEISYMMSDDMTYNKFAACALFYSNKIEDTETTLYIYNKYIGRLYANGCYRSAESILHRINKTSVIREQNPEMRAGYYLTSADLDEMLGKDPNKALDLAQKSIPKISNDKAKKLNKAKYDIIRARDCIMNDDFTTAEKIMDAYSENDSFGYDKDQVYLVCDYQIPYWEISVKLALHQGDLERAHLDADKYIKACDNYQFRVMKLSLLQYIASVEENGDLSEGKYSELLGQATQQSLKEMSDEYGHFLLSNINSVSEELNQEENTKKKEVNTILIIIGAVYLSLLVFSLCLVVRQHIITDGLTGLYNRRRYDVITFRLKKRKTAYRLLLFDLDDFKNVNDTFGHVNGDLILTTVAGILKEYDGRGINSFRYGGEELCMILSNVPEERSREIAEEIRSEIENNAVCKKMKLTVCCGIAASEHGEEVLELADKKLYEAKRKGKNRVE